MKIEKMVVGIDFSAQSELAVEHSVDIARHLGAEIVLVHVCPIAEPPEYVTKETQWHRFMRKQLADNRDRLERLRASLRGQGFEISHVVIDEMPDAGLIQCAEELPAELVVVGTRGHSGLDRLLLGNVAERVLRHNKKTTLVVRGEFRPSGGYRRILVATDFSAAAESALDLATGLVAREGLIDLRHFWHTPVFGPTPDPDEMRQQMESSTSGRAAVLLDRYDNSDRYQLKFAANHGNPKREILQLLDQGAYELVVMGSHGRKGLTRWLVGSVAEAIARHAPCSVAVVKTLAAQL
ncbi:MAG: universal stress protein [Proteobacteria bacterium]|nr:universal stress protein [Pseudomonadota bacterium]